MLTRKIPQRLFSVLDAQTRQVVINLHNLKERKKKLWDTSIWHNKLLNGAIKIRHEVSQYEMKKKGG